MGSAQDRDLLLLLWHLMFVKHLQYVWEQRNNRSCHEFRLYRRRGAAPGPSVLLVGGVHGNEPAGAEMLRQAARDLALQDCGTAPAPLPGLADSIAAGGSIVTGAGAVSGGGGGDNGEAAQQLMYDLALTCASGGSHEDAAAATAAAAASGLAAAALPLLRGVLVAAPAVNVCGLAAVSRYVPRWLDNDINRSFPRAERPPLAELLLGKAAYGRLVGQGDEVGSAEKAAATAVAAEEEEEEEEEVGAQKAAAAAAAAKRLTEPVGAHAMVLSALAAAPDTSLVVDFHEGWGYCGRREEGGSLGSSLTVFARSAASERALLRVARGAVAALNAGIGDETKRWVVAQGGDARSLRGGAFSNFCHERGVDYVLVETSGQGDIQPLALRVAQARLILLHVLRGLDMIGEEAHD